MKNTVKIISLLLTLVLTLTVFASCGKKTPEAPVTGENTQETTEAVQETTAADTQNEPEKIGEGETEFTFKVVFDDGTEKEYLVATDKKTVGEALTDVDLIRGEESSYGLYVTTVAGVTADYDKDGSYWAFYIDGEYAQTGVDGTEIKAGSVYMMKTEKA